LTRRTLWAALLALLLVPSLFAGGWNKSLAAAKKEASRENELIFVDLFADWCGWCHKMEQDVFPSEAFQKATDDMVLLRLNTEDGADGTKLARDYEVNSLPTFLVLSPDLMVAGVIRGYAPSEEFVKSLKRVEADYDKFQARLKAEPKWARREYQKRFDLAQELTGRRGFTQSESRLRKLLADDGLPADLRDKSFYELAVTQMFQKKYDDSLATIKRLGILQKKGDALERSRFLAGQIYIQKGNLTAALNEYKTFKTTFPNSPLVQNVDMILPRLEIEASKVH
jgi:thioredoxin-related protein